MKLWSYPSITQVHKMSLQTELEVIFIVIWEMLYFEPLWTFFSITILVWFIFLKILFFIITIKSSVWFGLKFNIKVSTLQSIIQCIFLTKELKREKKNKTGKQLWVQNWENCDVGSTTFSMNRPKIPQNISITNHKYLVRSLNYTIYQIKLTTYGHYRSEYYTQIQKPRQIKPNERLLFNSS